MKNLSSNQHIVLVGNGRLATQLKSHLESQSLTYSHVFRSQHSSEEIEKALQSATHIWLAISDSAIEEFFTLYSTTRTQTAIWVHFSGAHNSEKIHSVHPLMTFSNTPLSSESFQNIHMTVSPPLNSNLKNPLALADLIPEARNPWSRLASGQKAFYHALCVMAGNFPMILWSEAQGQFHNLGIPSSALNSYLDQILTNFKNEGALGLTGPLARKDLGTINKNLDSLSNHPFKAIYESFVKAKGINL